jgi:GntR family histidine utilization transcriptional repressor
MTRAAPAYQQIKAYVLNAIADGTWKSGEPISSEKQLAGQFAVARMTISRALWELSLEGVLNRVKGVGTFVAVPRCQSTRLEIRNIEDEIEQRGNRCFAKVLSLGFSDDAIALEEDCLLLCASKAHTFHSCIVYYENALPVQYEDRFVHADLFPDYLKQDFTRETPKEGLHKSSKNRVAKLTDDCDDLGMRQADLGLDLTTKRTHKREFLDEMDRVVPWSKLVALISPHGPEGKRGRPPFPVETMLRIHFMQQ